MERALMIRRPLFYITTAFAAAVALSYYYGTTAVLLTAVASASAVYLMRKADKAYFRAAALMMAAYAVGALYYCIYDALNGETSVPCGARVAVSGKVMQIDEEMYDAETVKLSAVISLTGINGETADRKEKVLINMYKDVENEDEVREKDGADHTEAGKAVVGDIVSVSGEAEKPAGRRNPGCFDYALYLKSIGVNTVLSAESFQVIDGCGSSTVTGRLYMIREWFLGRLEDVSDSDTAALMGGILFGETDGMDEDTLEEFRMNGTAHILSVSGLHIGIIYGVLSWMWRWRKGRLYCVITLAFFVCYMSMASFSPPVVRAVLMIGLHLLSGIVHKRYDLESSVYFAALLLMIYNPMTLFNTGFQMSFMAMVSLALVMPAVKRVYSGILLSGISVQIGLMPYTAYTFNYVSLGAVAVNIPIIFLSGLIVPLGLLSMIVCALSETAFRTAAEIMSGLCAMMTELNSVTTIEGVTVFSVVSPDAVLLTIYYSALLVFLSEEGRLMLMRKRRGAMAAAVLLIMTLSVLLGSSSDREFRRADVVFVDVGQGDCMHIRTEDGGDYLIDGGGSVNYSVGEKTLKPYLLKNGVGRLDGIFVTHLHTDHYKGAAELCAEGMAEKLFLYEGNIVREKELTEETGLERSDLVYIWGGQTVELSDEVRVEVLWPERRRVEEYERVIADETDENEASLVFKVTVAGSTIMMTGDIDDKCQRTLAEKYGEQLKSDVLKVPHHGSRYSYNEEFVEMTDPEHVVFQVGKNNFGHPDKGVVENYMRRGIIIYRNDEDGAVAFDFTGDGKVDIFTVTERGKRDGS